MELKITTKCNQVTDIAKMHALIIYASLSVKEAQ